MSAPNEEAVAHVRDDDGTLVVHGLVEHLTGTAELARNFARGLGKAGVEELASLAGLWHDLGKLSHEFQRRIRTLTGLDAESAHIETGTAERVDHSTAGGIHAQRMFAATGNKGAGYVVAAALLGHHTGLQNNQDVVRRLQKHDLLDRVHRAVDALPPSIDVAVPEVPPLSITDVALFTRMLFSTLIDADRRDTTDFMRPNVSRPVPPELAELDERLTAALESMTANAADTPVNRLRGEILRAVCAKAEAPPGFFRLTVPTGGGKTLTSLAFALRHALFHGRRRVIYGIPYTSIIEQTAEVFRGVLGDEAVLEHHANIDPDDVTRENPRTRLLIENWDAPLIVTTNVQLFESLFSRKTSRCRKLHNIAGSVLILDEVQTLPPGLVAPILAVLRELVSVYGVSVVLCTATQPAFASEDLADESATGRRRFFAGIDDAVELAPDAGELHEHLRRVRVHVPEDLAPPEENAEAAWDTIADRIAEHERVLTIVNTRKHARLLAERLAGRGECVHLSTNLCAAHRLEIFARIRQNLKQGRPLRVVSTQLVEAGVDLDFPAVFRAVAGLDSMAQAAGRCNREGRLEYGDVYLFVPPGQLHGDLRRAADIGRMMLERFRDDPFHPDCFRAYFRELFWRLGDQLDAHRILELSRDLAFETIDQRFQMIESKQTPVIVPYGERGAAVVRALEQPELLVRDKRAAGRFSVGVFDAEFHGLVQAGDVEPVNDAFYVLRNEDLYDPVYGLRSDEPGFHHGGSLVV